MNYSVFGRFQWIYMDANILETMPRKTEKKKIVFVSGRPLRRFLKKVRFQALRFLRMWSAKTMQYMCVFAQERSHLDGPGLDWLSSL